MNESKSIVIKKKKPCRRNLEALSEEQTGDHWHDSVRDYYADNYFGRCYC